MSIDKSPKANYNFFRTIFLYDERFSLLIALIMIGLFALRLYFLRISITNEQKIRENGGKEYGQTNTHFLTLFHILFYFFAFIEALLKQIHFDFISLLGLLLIVFSMYVLKVVIDLLGDIWTVKLMIAKQHLYCDHWLFKKLKHPNYYLNIIPELLGIALLCHATITAFIIIPPYAFCLINRILEENKLIKEKIIPMSTKESSKS